MEISNNKRDDIWREECRRGVDILGERCKSALTAQDFFETIDVRRTSGGYEVVTKIDYDVVGASIGETLRRDTRRAERLAAG